MVFYPLLICSLKRGINMKCKCKTNKHVRLFPQLKYMLHKKGPEYIVMCIKCGADE